MTGVLGDLSPFTELGPEAFAKVVIKTLKIPTFLWCCNRFRTYFFTNSPNLADIWHVIDAKSQSLWENVVLEFFHSSKRIWYLLKRNPVIDKTKSSRNTTWVLHRYLQCCSHLFNHYCHNIQHQCHTHSIDHELTLRSGSFHGVQELFRVLFDTVGMTSF